MPSISQNLLHVHQSISLLEKKYHRSPQSVFLLAISKGRSVQNIQEAIEAGHRAFGENVVQEALKKINEINLSQIEWHFTGHIQSNKTRKIAELFTWAHTVTTKKVAQRLNEQRPKHLPPLNVCLEVNVSREPSKSGILEFKELKELADYCLTLPRLKVRGLMTIPAPHSGLESQRAELHKLVVMKEQLGMNLDTLSMGMTDDMEAAIAEGATILRIGRGIFGAPTVIPASLSFPRKRESTDH